MMWSASGFRAWLLQRVSAVYMAIYILLFLLHLAFDAPDSYQEWRAWMMLPSSRWQASYFSPCY